MILDNAALRHLGVGRKVKKVKLESLSATEHAATTLELLKLEPSLYQGKNLQIDMADQPRWAML